jgi:hypothetical protein
LSRRSNAAIASGSGPDFWYSPLAVRVPNCFKPFLLTFSAICPLKREPVIGFSPIRAGIQVTGNGRAIACNTLFFPLPKA